MVSQPASMSGWVMVAAWNSVSVSPLLTGMESALVWGLGLLTAVAPELVSPWPWVMAAVWGVELVWQSVMAVVWVVELVWLWVMAAVWVVELVWQSVRATA